MIDLLKWLRQHPHFSQLELADQQVLLSKLKWQDLLAGETYCVPGEMQRRALLIIGGRLDVYTQSSSGVCRKISELGAGEALAESNLLTGAELTIGAVAVRDTVAVELSGDDYDVLQHESLPSYGAITRLIVNKLVDESPEQPVDRAVALGLMPLHGDLPVEEFAEQLGAALSHHLRVRCLTSGSLEATFGAGSSTLTPTSEEDREVVMWLSQQEAGCDLILLVSDTADLGSTPDPWTRRVLRQSDRILLLADANSAPQDASWSLLERGDGNDNESPDTELALLYEEGCELIERSLLWSTAGRVRDVHPVRLQDAGDLDQLSRHLVSAAAAPDWLRTSHLFGAMSAADQRDLLSEIEYVQIEGRHDLFSQGDPGDALFVVVSGRLQAVIELPRGDEKVVGEMGPGDVIGEIALVTGEQRTATIRAIRDSSLARLSKESFDRLAHLNPEFVFRLARVLADRMAGKQRRADVRRSLNFAVVPLSEDFETLRFVRALGRGFEANGPTMTLGAVDLERRVGRGAAQIDKGDHGDNMVIEWLSRFETDFDYVLYQCDAKLTPWTLRCLRQADRLLLVCPSGESPRLREIERELFEVRHLAQQLPVYLILVQPDEAREGQGTRDWLPERPIETHLHVRMSVAEDFSRVARILARKAVGLALGGGGSRGVAHIGILRAMQDLGVPADVVAGTSAGGGIAGLIALGDDCDTMLDKSCEMLTNTLGHMLSVQPPVLSMMSGRHPNRLLYPWFEESRIEDQFIPLAIVSVDLVTGQPYVHRQGHIWKAARASSSLPAAWPPVTAEGRVLVDGGVLNNLPIDQVQQMCANGHIVASDISAGENFGFSEEYGYEFSGWNRLFRKLIPGTHPSDLPSLMGIISRCCTLASAIRGQELIRDERVLYLQPPVTEYAMFDIRSDAVVYEVEQTAYDYAIDNLREWAREHGFAS